MNQLIKKHINTILIIFILIQPVLDLITGLCIHLLNINITIGIILRLIFLLFITYTTIFIYKKNALIIYCVILIYGLLYLLGIIIYKDKVGLFQELQGFVRVFYYPILFIALYELKDEIKISKAVLFTTLTLYLIFIFIPMLLGVGYKTYEITKVGTLGFFNSANEISGIISILTPLIFIILKENLKMILKILFIIIYISVTITIGTKTPLLAFVITLVSNLIWLTIKYIKEKKYKEVFIYIGSIIIVGISIIIIIIPKTNFYKNIKTHLDFLRVKDITEVLKKPELIDHFIFSQRLTFLKNKSNLYHKANTYQKLFGIGYLKNGKETKMIEMDYFDIYYSQGILGFILFFSIYFVLLYKVLKRKQKLTYERYMLYISLLLIIFLSLFTGHIITTPSVSILVIIIILSFAKRSKKDIILIAVTDNVKEKEIKKYLIDTLKIINKKDYKIEIITKKEFSKNIIKKIKFIIFNYHNYDLSIYYLKDNINSYGLALVSSSNNYLYISDDYKVLSTENILTLEEITKFKKIILTSTKEKKNFLKNYPKLDDKIYIKDKININTLIEE